MDYFVFEFDAAYELRPDVGERVTASVGDRRVASGRDLPHSLTVVSAKCN